MSKSNKKGMSMRQRRTLEGLMFTSPWIIGALLFFVYPIMASIKLSFSDLVNIKGMQTQWIGLENFKDLIYNDTSYIANFLTAIKNTLINTPVTLVFSLFIAMLINRDIKGRGLFRTIFFIPVLLGTGYIMKILVNDTASNVVVSGGADSALITMLMKTVGSTFGSYVQIFLSTITTVLWKSGVQIILFLAGLQGIPGTLYEASRCDGATEWENFWKITLPLVSPIILLNFVYTMIDSFTDASNPIIANIQHEFETAALDVGAAMGWLYFLFTFIVCGIVFGIMKKLTFNMGER